MGFTVICIKTKTNRKLIYCLFEISNASIANSSQVEILRKVLFSFLDAFIYIIMSLLPIFKVKMDDCSMKKKIGAIRVEFVAKLELFESFN